ncbi:MAG: CDP-glycerol glycerophosphotransferase family protein [Clostridium botulinum]|jgi:CDP-glycerol glycerophosphotransferase (TagB/SpsB family)|uniref:CDP-glycerol glycerophosphotransferase family protein n=1 Tax=uncultured Clostridium sp. TaxID=59620 RepID=UPI00280B3215|nr:CDP-glycerol glycerophosphotransferase family protein [uncultured Clostridium sp.]MDU6876807.1 CDP-glycerol glycerophosphotransferase family protein [Clostridium botulinum]
MEKIILFGASKLGEIALNYLKHEYNIVYFTDNDTQKWGKQFSNRKVLAPTEIKDIKDSYIIITSQYDLEIVKQLLGMGIKKFGVFELQSKDKEQNYKVYHYDYEYIQDFNVIDNKISLITENNSGSNTLALYKFINNYIKNKYDVNLIDKNNKNEDYYFNLVTSKMIVRTHDGAYDDKQINIQLWHGVPLKGLSYMSKYKSQNPELNHMQWNKLDRIISYSQTYNTLINSCYGVWGDKYTITGMPRNDFLFKSNGRVNLAQILNIDLNDKKVIFYMPTFRTTIYGEANGESDSYIFNNNNFYMNGLSRFLKDNNCIMILKIHPTQENELVESIKNLQLNDIYLLNDSDLIKHRCDLYEILNSADLLITDYSSVYFDYLLLNRPIIFASTDLENYKENRGFLLEPYDFWTPGPKCSNEKELEKEIYNSLNDEHYYERERNIISDIIHHYKDGNSSYRVWGNIDRLMEGN